MSFPLPKHSPSLQLAVRDAKKALDGFAETDTGMIVEVPIEALRWLIYGAESFTEQGAKA